MYGTRSIVALAAQSVAASGNTADIKVDSFDRIAVDINLKTLVGGVSPSVTFSIQRKDSLGNYTTIHSGTALTAVGLYSRDIGPGLETTKLPGQVIRIAWIVSGAPTSATADIVVIGDNDGG